MRTFNVHDHKQARTQLQHQKKHAWNIDTDIEWALGVDSTKFLLPLDDDAIAFPGATNEQRLVLSQLMGLIVNSTIAEMELVAHKIRHIAWREVLDRYPVNPEMYELGEQFFAEEAKHAELFRRYNDLFCESLNINPADLASILPSAFGALFQKAVIANSKMGGHAFWWVVAVVEEVALLIYQNIHRHRKDIDPLYYHIHRKHFEEESRHTNYAFLMLDLIGKQPKSFSQSILNKLDLAYSEFFSTAWVLSELHKMKRVRDLKDKHPFFAKIADCLPLMESMSTAELIKRLFVSAPYISLILNRNYHKYSIESAKAHGALRFKHPTPNASETKLELSEDLKSQAEKAWHLESA